ncbi:hypothetical protein ROZALSC1DRAFT_26804 [Rozella allomycis CSF55]|uniref:RmlC-like jelly roll fold domain-containing protein n=1 Tax=Rozella allomycis (strain CSF55) TaxID=988480 RepID=A0A075ANK9_ROZAC|nr:RmlC-like jelly roll fold domain-containing protein [Rozella allomycis CSF55]RKP21809.1 hypothetical protein ROZALSC1DRAFT_26804 [Rozella allomycis CSF55]|eukprot:EPZ31429.1 RmlC-like jelly roll fold domain-containing protein [Rozella allomycis CSF55]
MKSRTSFIAEKPSISNNDLLLKNGLSIDGNQNLSRVSWSKSIAFAEHSDAKQELNQMDSIVFESSVNIQQDVSTKKRKELQERIQILKRKLRVLVRTMINSARMEKNNEVNRDSFIAIGKSNTNLSPLIAVRDERPTFQVDDYKVKKQNLMITDNLINTVLRKQPENRSEADFITIDQLVQTIPYFKSYARFPVLRRQISKSLVFQKFERGRVILKQGHHPPCFVYFIIKGHVSVTRIATSDGKTSEWTKTLKEGCTFGDLEVKHDIPRVATITVLTDEVYLFMMHQEAFIPLISSFSSQLNEENAKMIKSIPSLKDLPDDIIQALAKECFVGDFPYHSLIIRQREWYPEHVYFVLKGKCSVVRAVGVRNSINSSSRNYSLASQSSSNVALLQATTIDVGGMFGDESMFLLPNIPDRKSCLREHVGYPVVFSSFEKYNENAAKSNKSIELTEEDIQQVFDFQAISNRNRAVQENEYKDTTISLNFRKRNSIAPVACYRKNIFSVMPISQVQCLLLPKVHLLKTLDDIQYKELQYKSFSHNLMRLISEESIAENHTPIDHRCQIYRPTSIIKPEGFDDRLGSQTLYLRKEAHHMAYDPFEAMIDMTLWKSYQRQEEWQRYRNDLLKRSHK